MVDFATHSSILTVEVPLRAALSLLADIAASLGAILVGSIHLRGEYIYHVDLSVVGFSDGWRYHIATYISAAHLLDESAVPVVLLLVVCLALGSQQVTARTALQIQRGCRDDEAQKGQPKDHRLHPRFVMRQAFLMIKGLKTLLCVMCKDNY